MVKMGLIGYGYWGPNLARIVAESSHASLVSCADLVESSLKDIKEKYPFVSTTKNYYDILSDKIIEAVLIVTPTKTHYKIAKDCLLAKKHVFVEKPLASNSGECQELIQIAKENNVILMVGHVFLFNPSVQYIKDLLKKKDLGQIRHLHFQRRNLGPIRSDVNVLWDLAPHDISMLLFFIKEKPISVIASGECYLQEGIEDVVSASIKFTGNIMANLILSWIDPIKIRDITLVGSKKMLLFDDVRITDKVQIFDKNATISKDARGVSFKQFQVALHTGNIQIPEITMKEPLREEFKHFVSSIKNNHQPITNGENGLAVVRILEALQESLKNNSKLIEL